MKKRFLFFLDGAGETTTPSSLSLAQHPNIDALTGHATVGFFQPVLLEGQEYPKTDVNIPYFFHVEPGDFIGRGALELIDMGLSVESGWWTCILRVGLGVRESQSWLVTASVEDRYAPLCQEIVDRFSSDSSRLFISPYSSHQNKLILLGRSQEEMTSAIRHVSDYLQTRGAHLESNSFFPYRELSQSARKIYFGGWTYSSLRGIFRVMGATANEIRPPIFDYQQTKQDLERVLESDFDELVNVYDDIVFYVKEPDKASHMGRRDLKIQAIEFADYVIGRVLPHVPEHALVAVLSDHPTDVGSWESANAPSPFLFVEDYHPPLPLGEEFHFCEQQIAKRGKTVSAQTLRKMLDGESRGAGGGNG